MQRKYIYPLAAIFIMIVSSCSKNENTSTLSGSFTFKGVTYTPTSVSRSASQWNITFSDTNAATPNSLLFYFRLAYPTTNKTLTISSLGLTNNNMMGLIYTYNNAHSYHPSRINDTANVSVSNGKLSISIPAVHMVDTQTMDTTVLSVHVSE